MTEVLTQAVTSRVTAGPTNLAFGTRTNLMTVVDVLGEVLGRRIAVDHRPARAGDVRHSQADNARLRSLFPSVGPCSLEQGITRTVEWMQSLLRTPSATAV